MDNNLYKIEFETRNTGLLAIFIGNDIAFGSLTTHIDVDLIKEELLLMVKRINERKRAETL